jgi:hypothetical protein
VGDDELIHNRNNNAVIFWGTLAYLFLYSNVKLEDTTHLFLFYVIIMS